MDVSISYLLADLDWSFRKVHVATLLVAVYCNIPRLFIFSINGVSFSSLLYICMDIFFLIFMHSRSFLQSTGGTELLIHSSYIICFVSNFNLFRPLFSWNYFYFNLKMLPETLQVSCLLFFFFLQAIWQN